jgi:hypothetical protein
MGEVYDLMNTVKIKFPNSKLILYGVLRRQDVSWHRMDALNDRFDWVAKMLGAQFVNPSSWIENWDFGKNDLHLNKSGARRLSHLYSRVCGFDCGRPYLNQ